MAPADRPGEAHQTDREQPKIRRDLLWNFAALGPLAVVGLGLNLIMGRYYGAETLGTFNQIFAVYVILSQIAVGGFCYSALAATAAHANDRAECRKIVFTALVAAGGLAVVVAILSGLAAPLFGLVFSSSAVAEGIRWVAPGLLFFALNKVLLFSLNGLGYLRAFAAGQTARYVLLFAAFAILVGLAVDGALLPAAFSIAEAALFVILAGYWSLAFGWRFVGSLRPWFRCHMDFGRRAFSNGLLYEINTKIDILVLGVLMPDGAVGVYAFAANIAEGIAQIPVAVQTVLTPRLSAIALARDQGALTALLRRTVHRVIPGLTILGIVTVAVYPSLSDLVTGNPAFGQAWAILAVLLVGVTITAGHMPFALLLNQAGRPEAYSVLLAAAVAANLAANLGLVPLFGLMGAALGTAASLLVTVFVLKRLTRRVLGLAL